MFTIRLISAHPHWKYSHNQAHSWSYGEVPGSRIAARLISVLFRESRETESKKISSPNISTHPHVQIWQTHCSFFFSSEVFFFVSFSSFFLVSLPSFGFSAWCELLALFLLLLRILRDFRGWGGRQILVLFHRCFQVIFIRGRREGVCEFDALVFPATLAIHLVQHSESDWIVEGGNWNLFAATFVNLLDGDPRYPSSICPAMNATSAAYGTMRLCTYLTYPIPFLPM